MTMESIIRIFAGVMILASLGLYALIGVWGLALALLVALNLIQSAFTGFCPAELILKRLGVGGPHEARGES